MHVGYLAQNWAAVETFLDDFVRQLHVHYGGLPDYPEPPQAFKRKRTYIRKAFAAHPDLAPYSSGLNDLLDTASRLAEVRHKALHSAWGEFDATVATLSSYSRSEPLVREWHKITIDEIFKAAVECAQLAFVLSFFGQRAFGKITGEQVEQALGELASKFVTTLPSDDPAD